MVGCKVRLSSILNSTTYKCGRSNGSINHKGYPGAEFALFNISIRIPTGEAFLESSMSLESPPARSNQKTHQSTQSITASARGGPLRETAHGSRTISAKTTMSAASELRFTGGTQRFAHVQITTSLDQNTWSSPVTLQSSGDTDEIHCFDITDVRARYVRITSLGNTENDFASITETDIYGP